MSRVQGPTKMAALPPPPSGKRERDDEDGSLDATEPLAKRSRYSEQAAEILADLWGGLYDGVVSMAVDGMDFVESDPDLALFRRLEDAKDRDDVLRITRDVTDAQRDRLASPLLDLIMWLSDTDNPDWIAILLTSERQGNLIRPQFRLRPDRIEFCLDRGLNQGVHPTELLIQAAGNGRVDLMQCFLSRGADIEGRQPGRVYSERRAPINQAIEEDQTEAVKFLLDRGADPCKANHTYPQVIRRGNVAIVQLLVQKGLSVQSEHTLLNAIRSGNPEMLRFCLSQGLVLPVGAMERVHMMRTAVNSNSVPMLQCLFDMGFNANQSMLSSLLFDAFEVQRYKSKERDFRMIQFLLSRGADIHTNNDTLFIMLIAWCDVQLLQFVLDQGIDLRARNRAIAFELCRCSASHHAYYPDTLRLLRDRGIDFSVLPPEDRRYFEQRLGKRIEDV